MKLSIGMIVKNEEKYLERCLTAIKPILENVDSELIITDTGSTDKTVEIAKKFTDNVIFYEWNKDFAAARNVALKAAHGEWFMYLDADEIFDSCSGIIDFFNSGKYSSYNCATYKIRNIVDSNYEYTEFLGYRLVRIFTDTLFLGKIHEHLLPIKSPLFDIQDVVWHYGYLYEDADSAAKKAERNIELLLREEEHLDVNNNPLLYIQLYDCYLLSYNSEKAMEYLIKGIEACRQIKSKYIAIYYNSKAVFELTNNNISASLSTINEYFNIDSNIRSSALSTDVEMYALEATILHDNFNISGAIEAYISFFKTFDDVKSGRIDTVDASALQLRSATDRNYVKHVYSFVDCCILCNESESAIDSLTTLPIYKYSEKKEYFDILLEKEMTVLNNTGFEKAYGCYRQLDEYGKNGFITRLIRELFRSEHKQKIVAAMIKIGNDVPWLKDKAVIYSAYISDSAVDKCFIENYIKKYGIQDHIDLVKIVLEKNVDMSCILDEEGIDLKACVFACCKYLYGFYLSAENYDMRSIEMPETLEKAAEFYKYIMETALLGDDTAKKNVELLLPRFADAGTLYMSKPGLSESELPEILHAAVIADNAIKFRSEKKYKECISEIKQAIAVYQPIAAVMAGYSKLVIDEYEQISKSAKPKTEMEMLAEAIKKNIKAYIAAGKLDVARKTIAEYKMIMPNDTDIDIISKEF